MIQEDKIRQRAFEIYLYRQEFGFDGNEESDWSAAEAEIKRAKRHYHIDTRFCQCPIPAQHNLIKLLCIKCDKEINLDGMRRLEEAKKYLDNQSDNLFEE